MRALDYPVGYNYIYTPRSFEPIGFAELRALAQNHDITRLCLTLGMHPAARADPPRPEFSVTFRRPPVDDSRDRTDHDPEAQNRGTDRMLRFSNGYC